MIHVSRSVKLNAPASEVWQVVGRFQALHDWHPAVETSEPEDREGVEHRKLSLAGGGHIIERVAGGDEMSYAYEMVDTPLPVGDYRASITVADAGDGKSVVTWSSTFDPKEDDAAGVIAGIYEAGFENLKQRFGGA